MTAFLQALQFGTPLALLGLLALPVIWWLLRFTPPRPRQLKFPPVRILLGLPNQEETPDKTPLWLLALRLLLATVLIFAVSQPFLQPHGTDLLPSGHRLVIIDNGWAAGQGWDKRKAFLISVLEQARDEGVPVSLVGTAPQKQAIELRPEAARDTLDKARLLTPSAFTTERLVLLDKLRSQKSEPASIIWLSDGIDAGTGESFASGLKQLWPKAALRVLAPEINELPMAVSPVRIDGNDIKLTVHKPAGHNANAASVQVKAINGRTLLDVSAAFEGQSSKEVSINLPVALRNEIQTLAIDGQTHAAARQLFDDRWRKRTIALQANENQEQAQLLLSPLHYLRRGLEPFAELYEPENLKDLDVLMDAGLTMLVLADVASIEQDTQAKLAKWIENGGILLRFAGPRLASASDELLPVKLREGDRALGSALSWEEPQGLQEFPEQSPFAGLKIDPSVKVSRQVLAEPDVEMANRTWASLADGTPLVTANRRGKGMVVLFHVTANANWSNLPLSGLFLEMLQRVAGLDPAAATQATGSGDTAFVPRLLLSGLGDLASADGSVQPIPATQMDQVKPGLTAPPGLYVRQGRERALNLDVKAEDLKPMAASVAGVATVPYAEQPRRELAPFLFLLAALLFLTDTLAAIFLSGGLTRTQKAGLATAVFALLLIVPQFNSASAQSAQAVSEYEINAALSPRLAYVETGNEDIDKTSKAGLYGLTLFLAERTSAELDEPHAINIERDEIVFYPLLYWPVDEAAEPLSEAGRAKISAYLKNGGMIFFDTRDGGLDISSRSGNEALQRLLTGIDLPPLEPVADNHVLTRTFYLLDQFPGRFEGPRPWVESALGEAATDPGTADGVSSIIIGANDYAAAWAIDERGRPLNAMVPGSDRQREFAFRTGVNVVMYALTGNYKADQVHVPAILERLGQ